LHGDRLGESLTTFVSKHPKAECKDSTETRTNCYQWTDVSIFGMLAQPKAGCSLKTYSTKGCVQGLSAQFVNHRLVLASYAVTGTDKAEPTAALKRTFGSPGFDTTKATIWRRDRSSASMVIGKATEQSDGSILITSVIPVTTRSARGLNQAFPADFAARPGTTSTCSAGSAAGMYVVGRPSSRRTMLHPCAIALAL
jgi:hypothetical protein